jgi:hypothetical protein
MNDITKELEKNKEKINEFSKILETIDSASDKKKFLWKEIYENACSDRASASMLFWYLYAIMGRTIQDHEKNGQNLVKYLDKMNKSNDQLLSLARQIAEAEGSAEVTEDDIFKRIQS